MSKTEKFIPRVDTLEQHELELVTVKTMMQKMLDQEEQEPLKIGDGVCTLDDFFLGKKMVVIEKMENKMVRISSTVNNPTTIEINESGLWLISKMNTVHELVLHNQKIFSKKTTTPSFRETMLKRILSEKEPSAKQHFRVGDIVFTISGPYKKQALLVIEKKEDGMVRLSIAPDMPADIEIPESELWLLPDIEAAFEMVLAVELKFKTEQ